MLAFLEHRNKVVYQVTTDTDDGPVAIPDTYTFDKSDQPFNRFSLAKIKSEFGLQGSSPAEALKEYIDAIRDGKIATIF